jgi:pimeloyl-ACP methyl ester carboxylesterase
MMDLLASVLRTAAALAAVLLLAIAGRRLLEKPAAILPPGSGERDTIVDGVRWRSREVAGDEAVPVVFIHGLVASSASWEKVIKAAAGGRRAIAVDLPGSGFSDRPWPYDYSVGGQSANLLRFLEVRGITRAVLVGNSLGGAVALVTAAARRDRVGGLVLVDAAWPRAQIPWTIETLRTPVLGEIEMELYTRPVMGWGLRHRLFADPANVSEAVIDRYWRPVTVPGTRRAALAAVRSRVEGTDTLMDKIHMPTLVVWGEQDRLLPPDEGRRLAAAIPGSILSILPHAGHMPQEEQPAEFSKAVTEFLSGTPLE